MNTEVQAKPKADYHDHDLLSQSRLKTFARDPQLYAEIYVHKTRSPSPPTPAMQFGRDVEEWLFTGQLANVVEIPDSVLCVVQKRDRTELHRKGKPYEAWLAGQPDGAECLRSYDYRARIQPLKDVWRQVQSHDDASYWVFGGNGYKVPLRWEYGGVEFMSELDIIHHATSTEPPSIVDVKTAADVRAAGFSKAVDNLDYDMQAFAYTEALMRVWELDERPAFFWVAIKNKPSYCTESWEASPAHIDLGRQKFECYLERWKRCKAKGKWTSHTHGRTHVLQPHAWSERNFREWETA